MQEGYDARGRRVGSTVVAVSPNFVTQIKNGDSKDGYMAVQLGTGTKKSVKKPQLGQFKKAGIDQPLAYLREVRVVEESDFEGVELGKGINIKEVFAIGDSVKVTGVSKGKGFQGGVRRWGFHGGPKTHGQSDRHRAPGSIGSGTTPGRVYAGKKMAGHMGVDQISTKGLEVIALDKANNLITIKGAIPGPIGALVIIEKTGKIKGYTPPPEEKIDEEEEKVNEEAAAVVEEQAAPDEGKGEGEMQEAQESAEVQAEASVEEVKS